jgi:formate dehydrogenase subunit gamma
MTGFQYEATLILIVAAALCPVHYVLFARRAPRPAVGAKNVRRYGVWERLVHVALVVSFLVLAGTGFWASIGWGGPMRGYILMTHTTFGAVFAVSVAMMLVTWATDHALARADGQWLRRGGCLSAAGDLPAGRFDAGQKLYFWFAGATTLVLLLSMLLSMIPWLGTDGQVLMYDVHRWTALALVVGTLWHLYATWLAKPGTLWSLVSGRVSAGWVNRYHPLWGKGAGSDPTRRA